MEEHMYSPQLMKSKRREKPCICLVLARYLSLFLVNDYCSTDELVSSQPEEARREMKRNEVLSPLKDVGIDLQLAFLFASAAVMPGSGGSHFVPGTVP
ncbi:hypothetical protein ACOMHN_025180 [Nucella lapillus]